MDNEALLVALRREADALAVGAGDRLGAPIPAVDGWTVADVVAHVGQGNGWVLRIVRDGLDARASYEAAGPEPEVTDEDALLTWLRGTFDDLEAAFRALEPGATGWTLRGRDQPLDTWIRRRAQETAVHRWDVDSASGTPAPVATDLALDGVDELFEVFVPRFPAERTAGGGETLHLHATDDGLAEGAGEWTITFGSGGVTCAPGHAKGDAAVRAPASDLLLLLWNRLPPTRLEVFGDVSVIDRWQSTITI